LEVKAEPLLEPARTNGRGLWMFLLLTFGLSWSAWGYAIGQGMTNNTYPGAPLYLLGGSGPSIAGVILLYFYRTAPERKSFWKRVVNLRQISPAWYGLTFLGLPAIFLAAIGLNALVGGEPAGTVGLRQVAAQPALLLPTILIGLVGGPISEELGWRGFALDGMVRRWGLFAASMILGLVWWAWHLPLFFLKDTAHYQWGVGSAYFWLFLFIVLPLSYFIALGYLRNQGSILLAILIHFMYNFMFGLVYPLSWPTLALVVVLLAVLALAAGRLGRYRA